MAKNCLESIRAVVLLGRYNRKGNNNFLIILLPETDLSSAQLVAERFQEKIAASPVSTVWGDLRAQIHLNIYAIRDENIKNVEEMVSRAVEPLLPVNQPEGTVIERAY